MPPSSTANLNAGMRCVKYMLFLINFMFIVAAILLISIGTTIQSIFGTLEVFVDDHFLSPPALVVATGIILLVVAVFGCIGAVKESTAMINIYGVFLGIIFILEIAAAISAFALQPQVELMLERTMMESIVNYNRYSNVQSSVDFIQEQLECCGVIGIQDWENLVDRNDNDMETDKIYVPPSCCALQYPNGSQNCTFFEDGCLIRMNFIVSQSTVLIATGALAVAFVQLLGVICAFMLAKTIRRTKSLREARRYQMQQSLVGAFNEKVNYGYNNKEQAYTQLENKDKLVEPITYIPTSPSVN